MRKSKQEARKLIMCKIKERLIDELKRKAEKADYHYLLTKGLILFVHGKEKEIFDLEEYVKKEYNSFTL